MKQLLLLLALVPALALMSWNFTDAQDNLGSKGKRALDLPTGGPGTDEDDEDAPEAISFFGGEYEGDAFLWCFSAYEF